MKLLLLSRSEKLYSTRRFVSEARALKMQCDIVNPLECQLVIAQKECFLLYRGMRLEPYDAVLPRIGASITEYGLAVVRQFESAGVRVVNGSEGIASSRNKLRSLQMLSEKGILVPSTFLTHQLSRIRNALPYIEGLPAVVKLLQGTQGVGVMLVHTPIGLRSVMETLKTFQQHVLVQQFLVEGAGRDYRALIVGHKVVAAMMRTATRGDFRSNIHQGGKAHFVKLPKHFEQVALRAAKCFNLGVAGVDLMESQYGPIVLEVNSSPGFEGIEKATQINVAHAILDYVRKVSLK